MNLQWFGSSEASTSVNRRAHSTNRLAARRYHLTGGQNVPGELRPESTSTLAARRNQ
jgi:hypothetical protein